MSSVMMKKPFSYLPSAGALGYCSSVAHHYCLGTLRGESVRIVEVGPRDGLQNEPKFLELNVKTELIRRLMSAGIKTIEATAFVSPEKVPQLADADEVLRTITKELSHMSLNRGKWPVFQALVPNTLGLERALKAGADEGAVPKTRVAILVKDLISMGCYEVSIADTIGIGTPADVSSLLEAVADEGISPSQMAVHFHNTYGQALPNVLTALGFGVRVIDTAIGGLGGCPFARGATGNVATEDVVYMLNGLGIETGIDLDALVDTTSFITNELEKPPQSSVAQAMLAKLEN